MDVIVAEVIGIIALVTLVAGLFSAAARRLGQPAVIGQIVAGVVLGPSVLGRFPGDPTAHLFPAHAVPYINVLGQVAVVIFMFGVGYEIEFRALRRQGSSAQLVALCAVSVPLALGVLVVALDHSAFAALGGHPDQRAFVMFIAAAVSISALPVLAAIVRDRGLAGTRAGITATAAAALMDVLAWLVLAAAVIGAGPKPRFTLPVTTVLVVVFIVLMLALVRPALGWWLARSSVLASPATLAFVLAAGGAWVTAELGLHPIFGAFLAGLTLRGSRPPDAEVVSSMERAGNLLLPLFFITTGLSLNVGSVGVTGFEVLALVTAAACLGKLVPAYLAGRLTGLDKTDARTVAALVNTRGLTELIALNVGLADGIITSRLFTVLVLMALVTTLATGPLLSAIRPVTAPAEVGEPVAVAD
ncbi:cation:proton antiporter [Actinospica durhamensis]|uniref:Cation:proton antiporter n=1 Tax=Actinospica durhamensis TaxID=1508375 RepID=A0A941ETH8_9ACTN|nr:cation:proton antiporter [Actinospica durhamensis]MBR7838070.1 cation:proton antiporter [Actinospica durhamensis]